MIQTDICIAGAGIIGLSLALELHGRCLDVTVVEAGLPMREASTAAAGMLAANDPNNPPELAALSQLSIALYPEFLDRLLLQGGETVPFQTFSTLQSVDDRRIAPLEPRFLTSSDGSPPDLSSGFELLEEHSIDPRQLAGALLESVAAAKIRVLAGTRVLSTQANEDAVAIATSVGQINAWRFVDCTGAWGTDQAYKVVPIKGQMLAVALPAEFTMRRTLRTEDIYIVPRTTGPSAGRAIIGATVEDLGYDKTVQMEQTEELRRKAVALVPQLARAGVLERWAGLRPATADRLPLIGAHPAKARHWIAAGHYRNGILLAPATARTMTQLLLHERLSVALDLFSASRSMPAERPQGTDSNG